MKKPPNDNPIHAYVTKLCEYANIRKDMTKKIFFVLFEKAVWDYLARTSNSSQGIPEEKDFLKTLKKKAVALNEALERAVKFRIWRGPGFVQYRNMNTDVKVKKDYCGSRYFYLTHWEQIGDLLGYIEMIEKKLPNMKGKKNDEPYREFIYVLVYLFHDFHQWERATSVEMETQRVLFVQEGLRYLLEFEKSTSKTERVSRLDDLPSSSQNWDTRRINKVFNTIEPINPNQPCYWDWYEEDSIVCHRSNGYVKYVVTKRGNNKLEAEYDCTIPPEKKKHSPLDKIPFNPKPIKKQ